MLPPPRYGHTSRGGVRFKHYRNTQRGATVQIRAELVSEVTLGKAFLKVWERQGGPPAVERMVDKAVREMQKVTVSAIKKRTPKVSKSLYNSIGSSMNSKVTEGLGASLVVSTTSVYAPFVEERRLPGRFPNIDNIVNWIKTNVMIGTWKGSPIDISNEEEVKHVAFLIGRKIARKGTRFRKPKYAMFKEGNRDAEPYRTAIINRLLLSISNYGKKEIDKMFKGSLVDKRRKYTPAKGTGKLFEAVKELNKNEGYGPASATKVKKNFKELSIGSDDFMIENNDAAMKKSKEVTRNIEDGIQESINKRAGKKSVTGITSGGGKDLAQMLKLFNSSQIDEMRTRVLAGEGHTQAVINVIGQEKLDELGFNFK